MVPAKAKTTLHCPPRITSSLICLTAAILTCGCESKNALFTGKDLTGWAAFPANKTNLWSVKNGIIRCDGTASSHLCSEKTFRDYHLHFEWRGSASAAHGGLAVHTTGWEKSWPECVEISLSDGSAGDILLIGKDLTATKFDITIRTDGQQPVRVPKQLGNSENLPGEWNSVDVFCTQNSISVFLNGFEQNELSTLNRNFGAVCLISKGSPMEFKNLYLNPINP